MTKFDLEGKKQHSNSLEKCDFNHVPFGLMNAPATFQRAINLVIEGLNYCTTYTDYVVVFCDF